MKKKNHLNDWLVRPDVQLFLGRTFAKRISILAWTADAKGQTQTDLARRFRVSKQAISKLVQKARAIGQPRG